MKIASIIDALNLHAFCQLTPAVQPNRPEIWDGHAGERIVKILVAYDNVTS